VRVRRKQRACQALSVVGEEFNRSAVVSKRHQSWQLIELVARQRRDASNPARGGERLDVVWGAVSHDRAAAHDDDAVGQGVGFFQIMRRQED
jgi:hypothetical protein